MQRNNNNAPILFLDIWLFVKLLVYQLKNVSYAILSSVLIQIYTIAADKNIF